MDFEVGMRVLVRHEASNRYWYLGVKPGMAGTVVSIADRGSSIGVHFDEEIAGHNCDVPTLRDNNSIWMFGGQRELAVIGYDEEEDALEDGEDVNLLDLFGGE